MTLMNKTGTAPSESARGLEQPKQREYYEHVSQIDFVAAPTQGDQRKHDARAFPAALGGGGNHHATSERQNRHVKATPLETPRPRLVRETQDE